MLTANLFLFIFFFSGVCVRIFFPLCFSNGSPVFDLPSANEIPGQQTSSGCSSSNSARSKDTPKQQSQQRQQSQQEHEAGSSHCSSDAAGRKAFSSLISHL
jgi:hypothetical protein